LEIPLNAEALLKIVIAQNNRIIEQNENILKMLAMYTNMSRIVDNKARAS